jgi:hypothetical protein
MQFRIGINLGDVIHDETRIYGDGINIAARLEALADPGGVLVSNTVHDQVRGKLPFTFEDVGERQVKNIEQPVRMYRLRVPGASSRELTPPVRRPPSRTGGLGSWGAWRPSWSSSGWQGPGGSGHASLQVSQGTARRRRASQSSCCPSGT